MWHLRITTYQAAYVATDQSKFVGPRQGIHDAGSGILSHSWRTSMPAKMVIKIAKAA